jgi:large subunit ribosomal protein L25
MVREIQRHPVNERLLHVDLLRISRTERVRAAVPLLFEGESLGARDEGAILSEELHEIEVEALPSDLPHDIVVDISSMTEPDSVIRASDLPLPAGVTLAVDPDAFVARVLHRRSASEDDEGGASAPDAPDEVGADAAPVEDSAATD